MSPPRISIVTPSFNQGSFLEATLRSVLSQDYPDVEYVVIDGGSTDGSVEILRRYADRLAYWTSEKDHGQYDAINKGFDRTTGDVMAWLNSDDCYLPGALAVVGDILRSLPEVEWLTTLHPLHMDAHGRIVHADSLSGFHPAAFWRGANLPSPRRPMARFIMQESTFWRRGLWERAGGRVDASLRYAADFDLWARFFKCATLYGVDAPLACFRSHAGQKTQNGMTSYLAEAEESFRRHGGKSYGRWESRGRSFLHRAFKNTARPQAMRALSMLRPVAPPYPVKIVRWQPGGWETVEAVTF